MDQPLGGQGGLKLTAADRRQQLLGAARQIVAEEGIGPLTMERVAVRAGVSKALVYLHFSNSTEVLTALLRAEWDYIDSQVTTAMADAGTFEERVLANVLPYLNGPADRGAVFRILILERSTQQVVQEMQVGRRQRVVAFWSEAIAVEYALGAEEAGALAVMLVSAFDGVAHFYWMAEEEDQRRVLELYMRVVRTSLSGVAESVAGVGTGSRT